MRIYHKKSKEERIVCWPSEEVFKKLWPDWKTNRSFIVSYDNQGTEHLIQVKDIRFIREKN